MITLAAPILIAAFFGAVLGGPPKKPSRVPVAVVDLDASAVSKAIVAAMKADTAFDLQELGEAEARAPRARGQGARRGRRSRRVRRAGAEGRSSSRARRSPRSDALRPVPGGHAGDGEGAARRACDEGSARRPSVRRAAPRCSPTCVPTSSAPRSTTAHARPDRRSSTASSACRLATALRCGGGERRGLLDAVRDAGARGTAGRRRGYNGYAHSFAGMGVQFILFMGIELGVGVLLMRRLGLWKRLRAAPVSRALLLAAVSPRAR